MAACYQTVLGAIPLLLPHINASTTNTTSTTQYRGLSTSILARLRQAPTLRGALGWLYIILHVNKAENFVTGVSTYRGGGRNTDKIHDYLVPIGVNLKKDSPKPFLGRSPVCSVPLASVTSVKSRYIYIYSLRIVLLTALRQPHSCRSLWLARRPDKHPLIGQVTSHTHRWLVRKNKHKQTA